MKKKNQEEFHIWLCLLQHFLSSEEFQFLLEEFSYENKIGQFCSPTTSTSTTTSATTTTRASTTEPLERTSSVIATTSYPITSTYESTTHYDSDFTTSESCGNQKCNFHCNETQKCCYINDDYNLLNLDWDDCERHEYYCENRGLLLE